MGRARRLQCGRCMQLYKSAYRGRQPLCKACRGENQVETIIGPAQADVQTVFDGVMLAEDLQVAILNMLGLHGLYLAVINHSWRTTVAMQRAVWRMLERRSLILGGGSNRRAAGEPLSVASLPCGGVCVVDSKIGCLQIFRRDPTGFVRDCPFLVGGEGDEPGRFLFPCGVACDGNALYVGDSHNHRVQKLRLADSEHLGTVGTLESGDRDGKFDMPTSLCVAGDKLYVCDENNHRIVVLGTDLTWHYAFGQKGSGNGEFNLPAGVAANSGNVYVVEEEGHRVQVAARRLQPLQPHAHTPHPC